MLTKFLSVSGNVTDNFNFQNIITSFLRLVLFELVFCSLFLIQISKDEWGDTLTFRFWQPFRFSCFAGSDPKVQLVQLVEVFFRIGVLFEGFEVMSGGVGASSPGWETVVHQKTVRAAATNKNKGGSAATRAKKNFAERAPRLEDVRKYTTAYEWNFSEDNFGINRLSW